MHLMAPTAAALLIRRSCSLHKFLEDLLQRFIHKQRGYYPDGQRMPTKDIQEGVLHDVASGTISIMLVIIW